MLLSASVLSGTCTLQLSLCCLTWQLDLLADRTNGRAIATLLRLSSVCRRRL